MSISEGSGSRGGAEAIPEQIQDAAIPCFPVLSGWQETFSFPQEGCPWPGAEAFVGFPGWSWAPPLDFEDWVSPFWDLVQRDTSTSERGGESDTNTVTGSRRSREANANPAPARGSGRNRPLGFRLRRRGQNTRGLEAYLASAAELSASPGGKTSEISVSMWLNALLEFPGGKLCSAQRVVVVESKPAVLDEADAEVEPEISGTSDWLLEFRTPAGHRFQASLAVYVKLMTYVVYRQRHKDMPSALRVRAVQKCKELDFDDAYTALILPGTITLAMSMTWHELSAWDSMMGGRGSATVTGVSEEMARGSGPTLFRSGSKFLTWVVGGRSSGRTLPAMAK